MSTVEVPSTHREEIELLIDLADTRFTAGVLAVTLGTPVAAYLTGNAGLMFYVHVALGAFWFGLDFFFKFVLGPSLDASPADAAAAVNRQFVPKLVAVAEPLSLGVVGSGIGLASLLGYWATPSIWLWVALGVSGLMLLIGFGPLHRVTTTLVVELDTEEPDGERVEALFGRAMRWGLVQTVCMLTVLVTMVGLRGVL